MADYDAIVIGAGNGGLTAALTLAKAGLKTLMLERHNIPGGSATSFMRGRFEFEVALHQLSGVGTKKFPGPLMRTFNDLGIADDLELVQMQNLYRVVYPGKMDITLKADRAASIATLQEHFPEEADNIQRFYDLIYEFCSQWVGVAFMRDPEASPEKYPAYFKYALKSMEEVMGEYISNPLLQAALGIYWSYIGMPPKQLTFMDFAVVLWAYTEFKPWHLKGGSQALSNAILNAYLEAGGEVSFNCGVQKIIVKNGAVAGVITEDGDEISAGKIVSNAGLQATYVDLIDQEEVPGRRFREIGARSVSVSAVTVFLGFDREPADMGIDVATNFLINTTDGNEAYEDTKSLRPPRNMLFTCYDVDDPEFSPAGCSQGALVALAYGEPWLRIPPNRYFDVKYEYAGHMLDVLYRVHPGCKNHVEELDIGTPLTHMRYLGHPAGAIYGFDHFAKDNELFMDKKSPITGLYHAGAWAGSGGFQPTLMSGASAGRAVIRSLKY